MKLLGIAFFFLATLCVCTVGEDSSPASTTVNATVFASASTSIAVTKDVNLTTSQATTLQVPVLTAAAVRATNESITTHSTPSSPNATQQITQGITTQPPVKATTTATDKSDSTTNTTQASGTPLAQNESLGASTTMTSSFTISLQKNTSAPGTSSLHVSSSTESKNIILPIVIALIVITLSVFLLVALYRMCQKKTPERQENGTEQAQSDKEGVKLLSVKTTSPETGEHSSQGKNKTRQLSTPQQ
ncbi:endomucin isoform X2 [Falco cherrug]|uniref:endomucin isoform X2 n=1 Tax=Falco cherrug TaxID=345164 RepID=UPI002478D3E1|nr:endomucin isoform X2 [Falco cherrug]